MEQSLSNTMTRETKLNHKWSVLFGTGLSGITVGLDLTIINTSLTSIQTNIGASINQLQWVMSGFGLVFCAFLVTMGRLGDLYGRKKLLVASLVGFALSAAGAAFANSPEILIAMRMLQGLCGAAILPCGTALTANAFPKAEQGRALGIYGSLIGIGIGLGPFVGGILNELYGWPSVFLINIPIVAISLMLCLPYLNESKSSNLNKVDWLGSILLVLALGSLTFAVTGGGYYGWNSLPIILAMIMSAFSFAVFYYSEQKVDNPIIPTYLFYNPGFQLATLIYAGSVAFHWPVLFLMPIYLQRVAGYLPQAAGLILASMTLMTVISPAIAGYFFDKKNKALVCHSIFMLNCISLLMFTLLSSSGPILLILVSFILYGLAWGIGNGVATPIALSGLTDNHDAGVISGALTTALNIFAVLSLVISVAIFNIFEKYYFFKRVAINSSLVSNINLDEIRNDSLHNLPATVTNLYKSAFIHGMHFSYIAILLTTLFCWFLSIKLIRKTFQR